MTNDILSFRLPFGRAGVFAGEMLRKRVMALHRPRKRLAKLGEVVAAALKSPLEFPAFSRAFVPGDRVALAVDPHTPQLDEIVLEVCQVLVQAAVEPSDISIVHPADLSIPHESDPRRSLPSGDREQVQWVQHHPELEGACGYLATSVGNERIYLSRAVLEADCVVCIGTLEFDDVLGVRGPASALFPALSNRATQERFLGQGHEELGLDDIRPFGQLVEEVSWLSGNQFSIGVIPGPGNAAAQVIAGHSEAVMRTGSARLAAEWRVELPQRVETVVLAVDADAGGHGWSQVCQAIDVGRRLVDRDGRIVVLSQIQEPPGEGLSILGAAHSPSEALLALRKVNVPHAVAARQLARALDWANIYLLSDLPAQRMEELFVMPLADTAEVTRLLDGDDLTAILCGAQHVYGRCQT